MDTVFWRTEQKGGNVPNALPTTIETLDGLIKDMTGDKNASNGVNGFFNTVKKIDKQENIQVIKKTEEVNVDSSTDSSDDDDMETKIRLGERWRNKRYQDLSEKEYKKDMETSTISFPVHKKVNIEIVSKQTPQTANNIYSDYEIQRAVPARIRSRSSSSSSHRSTPIPVKSDTLSTKEKQRVELSDYVEAKVKEMMDKEGVTLDFTDNKIRGKIVTKTTIIKEVTDSHGSSQFVEDEVVDEKNFGSDLDSMSSMSLSQYEERKDPLFSVGNHVPSSTFTRQQTPQSRNIKIQQIETPSNKYYEEKPIRNHYNGTPSDSSNYFQRERGTERDSSEYYRMERNGTNHYQSKKNLSTADYYQTKKDPVESQYYDEESVKSEIHQPVHTPYTLDNHQVERGSVSYHENKNYSSYQYQETGGPEPTAGSYSMQFDNESSASSNSGETIQVIHQEERTSVQPLDLTYINATIVLLGTEPNVNHLHQFLEERSMRRIVCASIDGTAGMEPYINLATKLTPGEEVIFIWAVETKTGEFSDDLVYMFADFIKMFSPDAIQSMIVVLWHPGSSQDTRNSVEDLTKKFSQTLEYTTTIGFAVMHYKPIPRFYEALAQKLVSVNPMRFTEAYIDQEIPEDAIESVSEEVEEVVDQVDSPVLLLVSPPGHGKSSVGNLLLGPGYFQVRGSGGGGNQTMQVNTGQLYNEGSRVTCIESPGLYEDGVDRNGLDELEKHLKHIGYITHLLVAWDALEWRNEDLDFVLGCLKGIFGAGVVSHIIFVVTFWDSDPKSRKERNKRKISFSTLENMITVKTQDLFNTSYEPPIFFVSSKNANDRSRGEIVEYLSASNWQTFRTSSMNNWINHINVLPVKVVDLEQNEAQDLKGTEDDGHDYEDVSRVSSLRNSKTNDKSKSMFDLAKQETPKKSGDDFNEKRFGGSMFGLQGSRSAPSNPKLKNQKPRGRTPSPFGTFGTPRKGKGRGSNLARKRSMSTGNLLTGGRGRGRRPVMMHQKSVDNVYVDDVSGRNEDDVGAESVENVDTIVRDSNYAKPERENTGSMGRGRRRRRVVSGSSFSLNLRGSSKDRRKESRGSLDRSRDDDAAKDNLADSSNSRPGSRFSQSRRQASRTNLNKQGSITSLNQKRGSRTSLNRSNLNLSRDDVDENVRDERRGSKSSLGRPTGRGPRSNQPQRNRGRSRSRQNLNRQPQARPRPGSRPPPGECNIL